MVLSLASPDGTPRSPPSVHLRFLIVNSRHTHLTFTEKSVILNSVGSRGHRPRPVQKEGGLSMPLLRSVASSRMPRPLRAPGSVTFCTARLILLSLHSGTSKDPLGIRSGSTWAPLGIQLGSTLDPVRIHFRSDFLMSSCSQPIGARTVNTAAAGSWAIRPHAPSPARGFFSAQPARQTAPRPPRGSLHHPHLDDSRPRRPGPHQGQVVRFLIMPHQYRPVEHLREPLDAIAQLDALPPVELHELEQ